jgi:hypothetical protein
MDRDRKTEPGRKNDNLRELTDVINALFFNVFFFFNVCMVIVFSTADIIFYFLN